MTSFSFLKDMLWDISTVTAKGLFVGAIFYPTKVIHITFYIVKLILYRTIKDCNARFTCFNPYSG